jgi:type VI secretion system protein ImpC
MAEHLRFELTAGTRAARERPRSDSPLRILVVGDFSAREGAAEGPARIPLAERRVKAVDVDSLDAWLAELGVRLTLPAGVGEEPVVVDVRALDDLHPDALYRRGPAFQRLQRLRQRLGSADGFAEAAAEVRRLVQVGPEPALAEPESGASPAAPPEAENDRATLARLLGGQPGGAAPAAVTAAGRMIEEAVGPHVVQPTPAHAPVYRAALDDLASAWLRELLRTPALRALEAQWRSLGGLVSGLETGEGLSVHVLDASRDEIAGDLLGAGSNLERSALYRLLVEQGKGGVGGEPWSLVVADFTLGPTVADARLLASLAALASAAGGPVIAAADSGLLGAASPDRLAEPADWRALEPEAEAAWAALRESPLARWVGLAMPRLLLRLPYGRRGERIESFAFEEVPDPADGEAFVWGNPAYGCALLIGRAFAASGWDFSPGDALDLEDLPAYSYDADGETRLLPCAEVLLSERAAEAILARGPMPWMSYRNRPAARLLRFQSLAEPAAALAGPWG